MPLGNVSFSISSNLRFRYEYQNNFNIKTYTNTRDNYLLERFRLNLDLKTQNGLKAFIQFQDSHCFDCVLKTDGFKGKSPYVNEMDSARPIWNGARQAVLPLALKLGDNRSIIVTTGSLGLVSGAMSGVTPGMPLFLKPFGCVIVMALEMKTQVIISLKPLMAFWGQLINTLAA